MQLPNLAQTASLLAATAVTAAGLNLGVLALNEPDSEVNAAEAPVQESEPVDLVALGTPAEDAAGSPAADPGATAQQPEAQSARVLAVSTGSRAAAPQDGDDDSSQQGGSKLEDKSEQMDEHEDDDQDHSRDDGHEAESEDKDEDRDEDQDEPEPETTVGSTPETSKRTTTTTQDPTTTARPSTSASPTPTTAAPSTRPPSTSSPATTGAPAPVTEYLTYEFEGVATIIIAVHDSKSLEFWSAITESGWAFMVEDDLGSKVKIKFRPTDGGDEAEFEAKLENGRLKIKREY